MKLWRGSNLSSDQGTMGLYRVAGIMSRLPLGGDPDYVKRRGLWSAVGAHVNPGGETEERFLQTSSFISFTESEERARYYAAQCGVRDLEPCGVYAEDAVVFEMDISRRERLNVAGVSRVHYRCDLTRAIPLHDNANERESVKYCHCEYCDGSSKEHSLVLIDVVRFLEGRASEATNPEAFAAASRDQEWLVWPTDFVPRLRGFGSTVPPSTIWSSHHFRYRLRSEGGR